MKPRYPTSARLRRHSHLLQHVLFKGFAVTLAGSLLILFYLGVAGKKEHSEQPEPAIVHGENTLPSAPAIAQSIAGHGQLLPLSIEPKQPGPDVLMARRRTEKPPVVEKSKEPPALPSAEQTEPEKQENLVEATAIMRFKESDFLPAELENKLEKQTVVADAKPLAGVTNSQQSEKTVVKEVTKKETKQVQEQAPPEQADPASDLTFYDSFRNHHVVVPPKGTPTVNAAMSSSRAIIPATAFIQASGMTPVSFSPNSGVAGESYSVQVASFPQAEGATQFATRLQSEGIPANVWSVSANGKAVYRVRLGPFNNRQQAQTAAMRWQGKNTPIIVRDAGN